MNKNLKYFVGDSQELTRWYESLNDRQNSQARMDRAKLRRCQSPYEIILQSPFYWFKQKFDSFIPNYLKENERLLALACIAGLLSHVKEDTKLDSKKFAAQLYGDKDKPLVSELRFNQLQKVRDWEEFYRQLRRCIALLASVNIVSLANDIVHWSYDLRKESYRKINPTDRLNIYWAMEYYQNLSN